MNKISYRELRFLVYFLPIFALKLMNITAENKALVGISIVCFGIQIVGFINEKMPKRSVALLAVAVMFTAILVVTCGKQGAFFSTIMILGLYKINPKRIVYKICFWVGVAFVIVSAYIERNGGVGMRYINGTWTSVYKRSNILFISFFAVLCLYLYLQKPNKMSLFKLLIIWAMGYGMYRYSGSRTGFLVLNVLVIMLFLLRNKKICNSRLVRFLCVNSPIIGFLLSYIMAFFYNRNPSLYVVNSMLQGRLALGQRYLNTYSIKLFGQHIFEDFSPNNYWCLDCAYLDMLLCYGAIFSLIWIVLTKNVLNWLYRENRYIEVATVVAYSVYGISETFLPNGFLNVSIFLYAEYIMGHVLRVMREDSYDKNNSNVPAAVS